MVARKGHRWQTPDWQRELRDAFTDPRELLDFVGLAGIPSAGCAAAAGDFPMRVPRPFAALMEPGNATDPLLRQVLPSPAEMIPTPGFCTDPVGDGDSRAATGLLDKYRGRMLLLATGECAGHCRYCFRRHRHAFQHLPGGERAGGWDAALAHIAESRDVDEVILSGGDPLLLDDDRLAELMARLAAIPHLRRLRLHSRIPVLLPSRITPGLVRTLTATRFEPVMVCHINHPAEIGASAANALSRLRPATAALLNQSVLLAGVNDCADTLAALSEALFAHGVLPYYLHQLDRVAGAAHFEVPDPRALELFDALRRRLPGYLVPRLVRETPGIPCKLPLAECRQP
jgi:EF-P beta-lysylation protein EpmB